MPQSDEASSGAGAEYRIEDLAAVSGTTVRTLQSYRNKGLLPPPRRSGRVVLFSDAHVERLALIADLISRGYSLGAIGELFEGLDRGEQIRDLLGFDSTVTAASEQFTVTPREVAQQFPEGVDALEAALGMGLFAPADPNYDGNPADQPLAVLLPEVLQAGAALVAVGIPLEAVVEEGLQLRRDADAIAGRLATLVFEYLFAEGRLADPGASSSAATATDLALELLPFASSTVAEVVEVAMRRQIHDMVEQEIARLLAPAAPETRRERRGHEPPDDGDEAAARS